MATLHLENVPDALYEALCSRARKHRKSIAAEVIDLLEKHIPAEEKLTRRHEAFDGLARLRAKQPLTSEPFPSAEEMIRQDRER